MFNRTYTVVCTIQYIRGHDTSFIKVRVLYVCYNLGLHHYEAIFFFYEASSLITFRLISLIFTFTHKNHYMIHTHILHTQLRIYVRTLNPNINVKVINSGK